MTHTDAQILMHKLGSGRSDANDVLCDNCFSYCSVTRTTEILLKILIQYLNQYFFNNALVVRMINNFTIFPNSINIKNLIRNEVSI